MAAEENTNWSQSVTGIVIRDNKVLLARHTYGPGKGKLIVPGGYVKWQESPQGGPEREYMEETGVEVEPLDVIGIRFNQKDWYVAFRAAVRRRPGRFRRGREQRSPLGWMWRKRSAAEDVPGFSRPATDPKRALRKKHEAHRLQRHDEIRRIQLLWL